MTHVFFIITVVLYAVAAAIYLASLITRSTQFHRWAPRFFGAGFTAHLLSTIHLSSELGYLPLTNMQESLSFFSLSLAGGYLAFERIYKVASLGSFIAPLTLIMLATASILHPEARQLSPLLQSNWFWFHSILAFASYACFTIAAAVAVMYLIQHHFLKMKRFGNLFRKLPSLEIIEEVSYRSLTVGFPLLTAAIISGSIWSEKAIGSYWSWDPKQTWSLIVWLVYAVILHGRLTAGWRGKRASILSIIGFMTMLASFFFMKHSVTW